VRAGWVLAALLAMAVVLWFTVREDEYVGWQNLTGGNYVPLRHHLAALHCVLNDCPAAGAALEYLLVDVVGNTLLFIPVGLAFVGALPLAGRAARYLGAVLAAMLFSSAIEVAQLFMPSRATDVDDVLFNTAGAMLGALLALLWTAPTPRRRRT